MSKGFILLDFLDFQSEHFLNKKFTIKVQADNVKYNLTYENNQEKLESQARYIPIVQNIEIFIYENESDKTKSYFKLPLTKLYQYPHKNHIIKINCVWIQQGQTQSTIKEQVSGILKASIVYLKDQIAKLQILVDNAQLYRDLQLFGKMDPFTEVTVGDVTSKTTVKNEAGKTPQWKQILPFTLESIPNSISFVVQDEDIASNDLVGTLKVNPHQQNWLVQTKQMRRLTLELLHEGQKAADLNIGIMFTLA